MAHHPRANSPAPPISSFPHYSPPLPCSSWTTPVSSTPFLLRDVMYPHRGLAEAFGDLVHLVSARLPSSLQASHLCLLPSPNIIPQVRDWTFLCRWPDGNCFQHGLHRLCHNYSLCWNGKLRKVWPTQTSNSLLASHEDGHMATSHSHHCSIDQCPHPRVCHIHKWPLTTCS